MLDKALHFGRLVTPASLLGACSGGARRDDLGRWLLLLGSVKKGCDDGGRADRAVVAGQGRLCWSTLFLLASGHRSLPW